MVKRDYIMRSTIKTSQNKKNTRSTRSTGDNLLVNAAELMRVDESLDTYDKIRHGFESIKHTYIFVGFFAVQFKPKSIENNRNIYRNHKILL